MSVSTLAAGVRVPIEVGAGISIEIGEIIANKFRVERLLGRGGLGVVVLATHLHLDERVALKFVNSTNADRILQEARACLRLKTEHIARVMDVGRHKDASFIVMEYLEGKDLQQLLEANGKFEDVGEAVELVTQVCEAVAEAHRAGIVHRDIKLANLFLVASRSSVSLVKLLDFGIASSVSDTEQLRPIGTLHYMAPESLHGVSNDPRTDLWSLGVVLFEMLTGWKPFESKEAVSLIAEIYEQPHLTLDTYRDDLPPELDDIIGRCLEKEPEDRFQSAGELAAALAPFAPARAQINIERAIAASEASLLPESGPSISGVPAAVTSSASLRASGSPLRASGSPLRASGSPLRASGSRTGSLRASSSRSVPTMTSPSPDAQPQTRKILSWAIAGVALLGLAGAVGFRLQGVGKPSSDPSAASPSAMQGAHAPPPAAPSAPLPVAANEPTNHVIAPSEPGSAAPAVTKPTTVIRPRGPTGALAAPSTGSAGSPTREPATPTPQTTLEKDPWHSSKPKLNDNPFR